MQARRCLALVFVLFVFHLSHAQKREYSVSVTITGEGSVVPSKTTAVRGDTIFLTVVPEANHALLNIIARLSPSASGGLSIRVKLLTIDATHYAFVIPADTEVIATFIPQPIDDYGRMPYALYLNNRTLLFINSADPLSVGETINGSTIKALWSGIDITHMTSTASSAPGWNDTDENDEPLYPYRRVVFDESFSTVRPTGLCNWFSSYLEGGPDSIEGLEYLNTSEVTSMFGMFWDCSTVSEIDVSHFDTSKVTSMAYMFFNCSSIKTLDLSNFDMRKMVNANRMFEGCTSLERILCDDKWYIRASSNMFTDCPMLHGAVDWDASSVNVDMANPIWGYFTYASGDLDEDGVLTPLDVDLLVQLILKGTFHTRVSVSDINHDSRLSLSDVTALVNRIK